MSKNLPKCCISFPVLHFGEKFMKIRSKYKKLQMHEKLHKMWMKTCFHSHFYAFFHVLLWWAIKAALHCWFLICFLIHLKWRSNSSFPNLMVLMLFFPNSTGPWPRLQKGRKILERVSEISSLSWTGWGAEDHECVLSSGTIIYMA